MLEFFIFNIPCIICLVISGWLAHEEKEGWGWFLFGAVLLANFQHLTPT